VRDVPQIRAAYEWAATRHAGEVETALAEHRLADAERLETGFAMLERGLFVVLFGQFERHVDAVFAEAREARRSNPDWRHRRGWDAPSLQGARVPFETKLAFVLDPQTRAFTDAKRAYDQRNHSAHGGTSQPVGSIEQLCEDIYSWQAQLRR
jgi:hypothetical protein